MKDDFSLISLLEQSYQLYPDKEYLVDGEASFTYKQLYLETNAMAAGLSVLGVQKGERVLVCLPNWHEFVVIFFSLAKLGATIIPCNPCYRSEDIKPILQNDEMKIAFTSNNEHFDTFSFYGIKQMVTVRNDESGCLSYNNLLRMGEPDQSAAMAVPIGGENDVAAILYSSGTTGKPKGVMLTHKNLAYAANISRKMLDCTYLDTIFAPVPAFHVFGLVPGVILTILTGAKLIFMEKYKAAKALRLIEETKATIHLGVPTMFILELNQLTESNYDLTSLRTGIIAGSQCPSEIVKRIRSEMGCNIKISYGLTETASAITFTTDQDDEKVCFETVGRAVQGSEIKIVDEKHQELPIGEIGELACKGPGVMRGYFRLPIKTCESIDKNGWFYTGDLAMIGEHGYVTIVGRKKDMIVRGGFKIYPSEVEDVIRRHPSVLDVAIVGYPNPVLGENSCAFLKLKPKHFELEENIKDYVGNLVAKYKIPDKILFIDVFPLTASGKIRKDILKEMVLEENMVC